MMTENFTSIARPYAMAAFEFALAKNALPAWEIFLADAAAIAKDSRIVQLMGNPKVSRDQLMSLFTDILGSRMDTEQKNFIHLIADHGRFAVLAEIFEQYKTHREEHDKRMTVFLTSAVPLSAEQQAKFAQAMTKRLKLQVSLQCTVDPELLGGAVIRAGDCVIDGSVRGKLHRLTDFI